MLLIKVLINSLCRFGSYAPSGSPSSHDKFRLRGRLAGAWALGSPSSHDNVELRSAMADALTIRLARTADGHLVNELGERVDRYGRLTRARGARGGAHVLKRRIFRTCGFALFCVHIGIDRHSRSMVRHLEFFHAVFTAGVFTLRLWLQVSIQGVCELAASRDP